MAAVLGGDDRLHRPPPRRHPRRRRRALRRRRRAGAGRRGPGPRPRADRPRRRLRPRRREGALASWPARAATPWPGSSTPAAPPPAPRSSGRWSTRCEPAAAAVHERWFALDLIVEGGRCAGVIALDADGDADRGARPRTSLLATGGGGPALRRHHQPAEATGDGVAMALRAGVAVADVEFMQFHPTALHHPAMPRPLLSEALRGHGALLRDGQGERVRRRALLPTSRRGRRGPGHRPPACSSRASTTSGSTPPASRASPSASPRSPPPARGRPRPGHRLAADRARPPTTCCGGVVTDLDGASSLPGCGRAARRRAPACTAPTAWRRTRCSRAWCSGRGSSRPSTRARTGPTPPAACAACSTLASRPGAGAVPAAGRSPADADAIRDELQRAMTATPACCATPRASIAPPVALGVDADDARRPRGAPTSSRWAPRSSRGAAARRRAAAPTPASDFPRRRPSRWAGSCSAGDPEPAFVRLLAATGPSA